MVRQPRAPRKPRQGEKQEGNNVNDMLCPHCFCEEKDQETNWHPIAAKMNQILEENNKVPGTYRITETCTLIVHPNQEEWKDNQTNEVVSGTNFGVLSGSYDFFNPLNEVITKCVVKSLAAQKQFDDFYDQEEEEENQKHAKRVKVFVDRGLLGFIDQNKDMFFLDKGIFQFENETSIKHLKKRLERKQSEKMVHLNRGIDNEKIAIEKYFKLFQRHRLVPLPEYTTISNSAVFPGRGTPDGVSLCGIVFEIKCPNKIYGQTPRQTYIDQLEYYKCLLQMQNGVIVQYQVSNDQILAVSFDFKSKEEQDTYIKAKNEELKVNLDQIGFKKQMHTTSLMNDCQ